jgi:sorting nexin-25
MAVTRSHLAAAAVAVFIAWGYLTHWQPKLLLLPYAFVAGVLATLALGAWLTASHAWNTQSPKTTAIYGPRHAAFVTPERWQAEREALTKRSMYMMEPLYPASYIISDSLDVLVGLILRDFVKSWYGSISKSPTFVNEVDKAVRAALGEVRDRLLAVDMVETVVSRLVPLITDHMRASYDADRLVRGRKLSRNVTESEELDLAIAAKYKDGRLHPAASLAYSNTKPIQQQHLRSIVARILPKIMPADMRTSPAVNVLIQEIVACAVLSPVMQMLADPDMWNQLMQGYVRIDLHSYLDTMLTTPGPHPPPRTQDGPQAPCCPRRTRPRLPQAPQQRPIPQTCTGRQRTPLRTLHPRYQTNKHTGRCPPLPQRGVRTATQGCHG